MATDLFCESSFAGKAVQTALTYDTTSLAILSADYRNGTDKDAAVEITGPGGLDHVFILQANTPQTSMPLPPSLPRLVSSVITDTKTGQQETVVAFPPGWTISTRWPA